MAEKDSMLSGGGGGMPAGHQASEGAGLVCIQAAG